MEKVPITLWKSTYNLREKHLYPQGKAPISSGKSTYIPLGSRCSEVQHTKMGQVAMKSFGLCSELVILNVCFGESVIA